MSDPIEILRQHNAWRRGDGNDPTPNPIAVGKAIDATIAEVKRLRAEMPYDMSKVIGLTHNKVAHIIARDCFAVTGFVLTHEDGSKCIVDMSAVRWFHDADGRAFFRMMHPDNLPLDIKTEACK
jgi:hypothetical protein